MNDASGFAVSWSAPKELINRLQFGAGDLWPEGASTSDRWRFIAQLIDSDRGMLLELGGSGVDRALLAVGEELALIGLDGMEQDLSVATWLCMDVLDRFASAGDAVGYWVEYMQSAELNTTEQHGDSESIDNDGAALAVAF